MVKWQIFGPLPPGAHHPLPCVPMSTQGGDLTHLVFRFSKHRLAVRPSFASLRRFTYNAPPEAGCGRSTGIGPFGDESLLLCAARCWSVQLGHLLQWVRNAFSGSLYPNPFAQAVAGSTPYHLLRGSQLRRSGRACGDLLRVEPFVFHPGRRERFAHSFEMPRITRSHSPARRRATRTYREELVVTEQGW